MCFIAVFSANRNTVGSQVFSNHNQRKNPLNSRNQASGAFLSPYRGPSKDTEKFSCPGGPNMCLEVESPAFHSGSGLRRGKLWKRQVCRCAWRTIRSSSKLVSKTPMGEYKCSRSEVKPLLRKSLHTKRALTSVSFF